VALKLLSGFDATEFQFIPKLRGGDGTRIAEIATSLFQSSRLAKRNRKFVE
jgi:hypothetical protein